MNKGEVLVELMERNNGYLFSRDVESANISRTYLAEFVKKQKLEKVSWGVYVSEDTWPDDLFIMQRSYPTIVFSKETALYLHGMLDREYSNVFVSVPQGFSGSRLRSRGVVIHEEKEANYDLGITEVVSGFGNKLRCYDRERCICDLIKDRKKMEVQNFQSSILGYMRGKEKELSKLIEYAEKLGIRGEVMKYVEVLA